MESNSTQNSLTDKAGAVPADGSRLGDAVAPTQTQAQHFSQTPLSPDSALPGEQARQAAQDHGHEERAATPVADKPGPGFVVADGDVGGAGHNETAVDIIAVPCPGADPIETWTYDPQLYTNPSSRREAGSRSSLRRPSPWVTSDLRTSASIARVLIYKHRALEDGMTLESLSEDLLEQLERMRNGLRSRPLFFIAHSIGGLVVKTALVKANQGEKYQAIVDDCHGVTFLGTPHRGSSYMSAVNLRASIRELLRLQATLPGSLTDEIRVNTPALISLHDKFVDMASEFRLWSFYETQESLLSGSAVGLSGEVQFSAPLVSVKSALLELWQEDVYAAESDHAHLASFSPSSAGILDSYLVDLAEAIQKAARLSRTHTHTPLHLKSLVKVEVIGFYEDPAYSTPPPDAEATSIIRLYSTKYPFKDFLKKGPDICLSERLHKGTKRRPAAAVLPPDIVVTGPEERLALLTPAAKSDPTFRPSSSESNASVSTTVSDSALPFGSEFSGEDLHPVDRLAKQRADEHGLTTTAGFSRPKISQRKFMWVHMAFNNPVWVKEIFHTLERTQGLDCSRLFEYDNWESKQIQNRNSESQPAYLKAMCKYLSTADRLPSPRIPSAFFGPVNVGITPNCLYLYLPYLHFDTYHGMIRRRKLIANRRLHGRAKPVPEWVAQQESVELKMIWEYIGFDPPLNCRRTLDQFGHPSLRNTQSRDDDQMLYKLTKEDMPLSWSRMPDNNSSVRSLGRRTLRSKEGSVSGSYDSIDKVFGIEPGPELKNGYVLMIDQLWLWSIDMTTLTTSISRRESNPAEGTLFQQADLRNSVYNELNGDLTGRTENTLDLAALIVFHAVTVLLDRSSHPDLEIFRIFDEAIGMLTERMTLNMKQFRMHALDPEAEDDDEDSDDSDTEGGSPAAIKKRHQRELERSERENKENTSALLELRDLEDELSTLQKLFDMQDSTIRQMKEIYTSGEFKGITRNGQDYLDEALEYLEDYKQQTAEMLKRVDTTRNDYEKMLEMVQRQAQVDEVRWSRLQAELASSQNLSVMIFTTFTVIFLPLTFFTGLFGMNTIEWQDENIPSLREIGAISLPASILLIVVSLVAAFSWRVQSVFKATYRGMKSSWKFAKSLYAERLEPLSRKQAKRMRREEKKRRIWETQMARRNDQGYDFWPMVKRQQRDVPYHIPDQNVNSTTSADVSSKRKWP